MGAISHIVSPGTVRFATSISFWYLDRVTRLGQVREGSWIYTNRLINEVHDEELGDVSSLLKYVKRYV